MVKKFDSSYFIRKGHIEKDSTQNQLVFQPMQRNLTTIANTKYISEWKPKGLSDESIKPPATSDNSLSPLIDYLDNKIRPKFNRICLKQNKLTYTYEKIVNIYIVYEVGASSSFNDYLTLKNSLFGAVRLTKNADIDKYRYSGFGTGFDGKGSFSFPGTGFGQNVIIFGGNMRSSVHVVNREKTYYIWVLDLHKDQVSIH